ncbi:MAG TPA: type II/IV secretion system ATPase subunit, partial [Methanocella sp.]|nr:type II/IV secretion system ATPase subunit [Methanocella sp.]
MLLQVDHTAAVPGDDGELNAGPADLRLKKMPLDIVDEVSGACIGTPTVLPPAATDLKDGMEEVDRYWITEPFSSVSILYDSKAKEYIYYMREPALSRFETELLERLYDDLRDLLIRSDLGPAAIDRSVILRSRCDSLLGIYGIRVEKPSRDRIQYYIERNYLGYNKIDPLMRDDQIEDISCNGVGIPIFLFHMKYQNIKTNIVFTEEDLNSMVVRLAQRGGKHISIAMPIVNTTLPNGSRIEATLGREITTRGSSFTIRRFRADPFTPIDLLNYNTMSQEVLAYLWLAIENNRNLLFAGGTASGKTSSLNAVSLFIPRNSKVISIEDTRELTLFHSNWIAGLTRESQMQGNSTEIGMYDLLRAALRQRPEYIIVGEVRGREALTLFQAMNTGHTTYSTMHAGSIQAVVNRLLNEPINVPNMMLTSLNIVCIQELVFLHGKKLRRNRSVVEITGVDPRTNNLRINEVYRWNSLDDAYEVMGDSIVIAE